MWYILHMFLFGVRCKPFAFASMDVAWNEFERVELSHTSHASLACLVADPLEYGIVKVCFTMDAKAGKTNHQSIHVR